MRWIFLFVAGCLGFPVMLLADRLSQKNVLILQGQRADLPGLQLIAESVRKTFDEDASLDVNVFTEFLDLARFPRAKHDESLSQYLKARYADRQIDLVIPIFGPALEFTIDHRADLFPGIPVVFCFVDKREAPLPTLPPDVMGVYLQYDFERTLKLATTLQPGAREVVLITGSSDFDRYWTEQAQLAAAVQAPRIPNRTLSGPLAEVLSAVRSLSRDTIVLYVSMYRDGSGHDLIPADVAASLAEASGAPVYGTRSNWVDQGLLGGAAFDHTEHGRLTGQLALAALKGTKATDEASAYQSNPSVVNWNSMKKWGISPELIPSGTEIRFRPPSFWQQHRQTTLFIFGVMLIQCALITALIIHRARLRRSQRALDNRLNFETQIANAAVELIDLPPDRVDQKVEELLREALNATGLDRSVLFEYLQERGSWRITHSVSNDGGIPVRRDIPFEESPFLHNRMKDGKDIILDDIERDLPPEAEAD
ncbi:MAG TPA: ABC transporter substrate binding protein, partial [Chthoniobacteraceae bacterium]|nr:ABC transporter substrate binding protein [Chthoniobacteraceae bacterium]